MAMQGLLSRILDWRRISGLAGGSEEHDHLLGCLGNPDADIVFLAEIPSLNPPGRRRVPDYPPDERWKMMWNVSPGDKTFREALTENGFIPSGASDQPWRWRCWVTNIVKCPESDKVWKQIKSTKGERRQKILDASSAFLGEELGIVRPKMIVVMGNATAELFDEFVQTDVLDVRVPHYARMTQARKPLYLARFRKITQWYLQMR